MTTTPASAMTTTPVTAATATPVTAATRTPVAAAGPVASLSPLGVRPPDRAARRLLLGGVVGGPLFLVVGLVQGLTRDGFSFTRNAISQLALGEAGWIQTVNFLLAAVLLGAGALGLRRALYGAPGGTWVPVSAGVFGASFAAAAVFPADAGAGFPAGAPETPALSTSGAVHMLGGMIGYLALCAVFLLLARVFTARGDRAWALGSRLAPVAVLAGFAASAATVTAFTAGAAVGLCWLSAATARLRATGLG
ncbi:DUF998 domain-containing protein [Streptomyces lateritius]|uniref:DUF998 domain-containing protein n=1 Tax=Streptomyces lateritius TaxID=67313 RepID=UPI0021AB7D67|nr:DUF998 domain-containing protein [Streptomyces lateritius]